MKSLNRTSVLIILKLTFRSPFNYYDYHSLLSRTTCKATSAQRQFMNNHEINGHHHMLRYMFVLNYIAQPGAQLADVVNL